MRKKVSWPKAHDGDGHGEKVEKKIGGKFINRRYLLPTFFAHSLCLAVCGPRSAACLRSPLPTDPPNFSSSPFLLAWVLCAPPR